MATLAKKFFTPAEYFKLEETSEDKHEYRDGVIVPMAGASANHSQILFNLTLQVGPDIKKRECRLFDSNMRVQVRESGLYTYPDMTIVCGKVEYAKGRKDTITNPTLIVEVLSPSTRTYERGYKFDLYRPLKSLQAYVLIDSEQAHVDYFQKRPDGKWEVIEYAQLTDKVAIPLIGVHVPLAAIYDMVDWLQKATKKSKPKRQ
jgi:Uma2 family endonuclease